MEKKGIIKPQSLLTRTWLFLLDIGQTFVITGVIFFFVTFFLFRPFQVSGDSMYSNFKDKEYIITSIISLRLGDPKHGDVIVFKSPTNPDKDFIKRVVAVPGDTIYLREGYVYINNIKLNEYYLDPGVMTYGGVYLPEGEEKTLPPDNYFVMGDNRMDSSDSRQWGLVNKRSIKGISVFVYWPLSDAHIVKNPY